MSAFPETAELIGENLACRRGERLVFSGLDLRLGAGGALVFIGANGSGKSSLLRLLATLLTPASGHLSWDGAPVERDPATYRAALHYVGHLDATKPALSALEMLGFWAAMRGGKQPALDEALELFGLGARADWPCRWLSAGQRRRLALARLVAAPAPVWLLDEPSAALDRDGEARLEAAIAGHRAAGGRVVAATHQPLAISGAEVIALDDFVVPAGDPLADWC